MQFCDHPRVLFTNFILYIPMGRFGPGRRAARGGVSPCPVSYTHLSAVLAGMAGALYGLNYSTVQAAKFKFDTSILILVFVVLGGIGNIRGSIIAAALLTVLPEVLRSFGEYRMLIYAIVLILVMLATNNPAFKAALGRCV